MAAPRLFRSGHEITDEIRAAALRGDGRAVESSFGVWRTATNYIANGGFEINTTGWNQSGSSTIARSTVRSKFGAASMKLTATATGADSRAATSLTAETLVQGSKFTASFWVYGEGNVVGRNIQLLLWETGGAFGAQPCTNGEVYPVILAGWNRYKVTGTIVRADRTDLQLFLGGTFGWVTDEYVYIDGVQVEQSPFPTPYIETNGAVVQRPDNRIQLFSASSFISSTQGWMACRVRPGWNSVDDDSTHRIFDWRASGNHYMGLMYDAFNNRWTAYRPGPSGVAASVNSTSDVSENTLYTVVFAWTATQLKISVNGAPFVTVENTGIPTIATTYFDLLSQDGGQNWDGETLWVACGTGTLSDADAAMFAALQNSDPRWNEQLISLGATAIMPFNDDSYSVPTVHNIRRPRVLNGNKKVEPGDVLTVDPGVWGGYPAPVLNTTWQRAKLADFSDAQNILQADSTDYRVTSNDRGYKIRAKVEPVQ
jgi:hypothetical protein